MALLRFAFAAHGLTLLVIAAVLQGVPAAGVLARLALAAAIVLYIVAGGALLVAHHTQRRSILELAAAALYPAAVYIAAYRALPWSTAAFWVFLGAFHFLAVAGGFLLGLFSSPLLAVASGAMTREQAGDKVHSGIALAFRQRGAPHALAALALALLALGYALARATGALESATTLQRLVLAAGFVGAGTAVAVFTWTATVFAPRDAA